MDQAKIYPRKVKEGVAERVKVHEPATNEQERVEIERDEVGGVVVMRGGPEGCCRP
jgi:hypothetical protein